MFNALGILYENAIMPIKYLDIDCGKQHSPQQSVPLA